MATKQETMDYILSRIQNAGVVRAKKMFGEYGVYCDEKMVALVADDQLFVKPTVAGKEYLGEPEEAPPYPGAKNWYLIPEDDWDDEMWLSELIRITAPELSVPKKKRPKIK